VKGDFPQLGLGREIGGRLVAQRIGLRQQAGAAAEQEANKQKARR
jgi:hypothetical protein